MAKTAPLFSILQFRVTKQLGLHFRGNAYYINTTWECLPVSTDTQLMCILAFVKALTITLSSTDNIKLRLFSIIVYIPALCSSAFSFLALLAIDAYK